VQGLVADADIKGQFVVLLGILESESWIDLWHELNIAVYDLTDLDLHKRSPDLEIWQTCQEKDIVLLTANRNLEGEDSLESAIRQFNHSGALPVLTLSNPGRILRNKRHAHRTAERLFAYLLDIEKHRGAGRIYIP